MNPSPAVPVLHELRITKDASEWLKTLSPYYLQTNEDLEKLWGTPVAQFSLTLLQDPEFKNACDQMSAAHARPTLISYELVLILLLWIFRSWRLSKVETVLKRVWTQAWIGFVFWALAIFAVPSLVYGSAYETALKEIFRAILRHFFV